MKAEFLQCTGQELLLRCRGVEAAFCADHLKRFSRPEQNAFMPLDAERVRAPAPRSPVEYPHHMSVCRVKLNENLLGWGANERLLCAVETGLDVRS